MITVAILINGEPIMARSAVNTGEMLADGSTVYAVDDGSKVYHRRDDGAVKLAEKLLRTIKEQAVMQRGEMAAKSAPVVQSAHNSGRCSRCGIDWNGAIGWCCDRDCPA